MLRTLLFCGLLLLAIPELSDAQTQAPRKTPSKPLLPDTSQAPGGRLHMNSFGKPCLTVRGNPKAQLVNPNLFSHMIVVTNTCSMPIKLKVCYYKTQNCVPIEVLGYGRKEAILGIFPAMKSFRFEHQEQF
jgi:hypothetical protein